MVLSFCLCPLAKKKGGRVGGREEERERGGRKREEGEGREEVAFF